MHHLLKRQIRKYVKEGESFPKEFVGLLDAISKTYENNDNDRALLEHSFNISSREFIELNAKVSKLLYELEIEKKGAEQRVVDRTQELVIANKRLVELDKVKTEFISVAAHQLRTPLSAIKWILSIMIDEENSNLTAEQKSLIMKGYESNERIIRLINEMLIVARIESGKMAYSLSSIHIEDLIENCLEDFVGQAKVRNLKLIFKEPSSKLPYISTDPDKIRAVLQNLIENALNYTKDGGKIEVYAEVEGSFVKVSVKDNGIGIPEKQKIGIFNKFFRAENALKTRTDGSGLGLFVAKSIVEKNGGVIGFDSVENQGTVFYFTMPFINNKN